MADDSAHMEPLSLPLTRPPMYFGVDIKVYVINGCLGIVLFIGTSNFLAPAIVLPVHFLFAYLCQKDMSILNVLMTFAAKRKALGNLSFWKAGSYAP